MEARCSCSACTSFACVTKNESLCHRKPYRHKKPSQTYLYINKTDKTVSPFSFNEFIYGYRECDEHTEQKYEPTYRNEKAHIEDDLEKARSYDKNLLNILRPSTAKLTAQIMKDSLIDFETLHGSPQTAVAKLTPFDIFEKIKDVYKACSCKVCECIVGKSKMKESCKCEPCECDECTSLRKKVTISTTFTSTENTQARSEVICEKSSLKVFRKKEVQEKCDCKPCECDECSRSVSTPRSYKRDRAYVDCTARHSRHKYQKLVVAAVGSGNQTPLECACAPCDCAACSHRGTMGPLRREISTEINRPDGCHCDACPDDGCAPDTANTCSCDRHKIVMRKPVQRDTEFDIHQSLISQRNPCHRDLIAMFASISKVHPSDSPHGQHCMCDRCKPNFKIQKDYDKAARPSNTAGSCNKHVIHDTVNFKLPPLEPCLLRRHLHAIETEPSGRDLEISSEKNTISTFSSNNKHRPCAGLHVGNDSCMKDASDSTHCKFNRCLSKDEVYPIKKGETFTPAIFKTKVDRSLITFCDDNGQNEEDYMTPQKKPRLLSDGNQHDLMYDLRNDVANFRNANTKLNRIQRVKPFTNFANTTQHSIVTDRTPTRNYESRTSTDPPMSDFKYKLSNHQSNMIHRNSNCYNFNQDDSNNSYKFETNRTTVDSNDSHLKNLMDRNLKQLDPPKNYKLITPDLQHLYENKTPVIHAMSSKSINAIGKSSRSGYYECFDESCYRPRMDQDCQCIISMENKSNVIQPHKKDDVSFLINELYSVNSKPTVQFTNNYEKDAKYLNKINSNGLENCTKPNTNDFYLDEDYIRAQKTIKDSKAFSRHLLKLLEKYEKANREFENIYHKLNELTQSDETYHLVKHMFTAPQNDLHRVNKASMTENYDRNCKTEPLEQKLNNSESQPTNKENNISNIRVKSKQSSSLMKDNNNISSKYKYTVNGFARNNDIPHKDKQKKLSTADISHSNTVTHYKHASSTTVNDSVKNSEQFYPITQTNISKFDPQNISSKRVNVSKMSKRPTKMYKQAVIATKRKNRFVPTFAKCSVATETLKDTIIDGNPYLSEQMNNKDQKSTAHYKNVIDKSTSMTTNNLAFNNIGTIDVLKPCSGSRQEALSKREDILPTKITVNSEAAASIIDQKDTPFSFLEKPNQSIKHLRTHETNDKKSSHEISVGVHRKQSLGKRIKEAVNEIKQASMTWESNYAKNRQSSEGGHENIALVKLHHEVQELLELPLLKKSDIVDVHFEEKKDKTVQFTKSEFLQVRGLTVKALSGGKSIVKWDIPEALENVLGYEVIVNGRLVQKIEDKKCQEITVPGLPSDKAVVSVRTVTWPSAVRSQTATVIYRPTLAKARSFGVGTQPCINRHPTYS